MNTIEDVLSLIKTGDHFVGDGHDWSAALQHFCNGPGATHGCVVTFPGCSKGDMKMVLSAEYNGIVHEPFVKLIEDPKYNFWIFRVTIALPEEINYAGDYCEREFLDDKYAYFSWPWFGWYALWKRILNPALKFFNEKWQYNIDKEHNWYFKDCYCTEHTWWNLKKLTELCEGSPRWAKLVKLLAEHFPDTFQPVEYRFLLMNNPDIFKLIAQRIDGNVTIYE